jgi:hypothetical protein
MLPAHMVVCTSWCHAGCISFLGLCRSALQYSTTLTQHLSSCAEWEHVVGGGLHVQRTAALFPSSAVQRHGCLMLCWCAITSDSSCAGVFHCNLGSA